VTYPDKQTLLESGKLLAHAFCIINDLPLPAVEEVAAKDWKFDACAYYRKDVTTICVTRCASIGVAGMAWSYPGYSVDRTPYGVLQHELGHHVDLIHSTKRGPYYGDFSIVMRTDVDESPLTSYCPNDAEWFAEMFRLFVTNPDLLAKLKPRTHRAMMERFDPVFSDSWRDRLAGCPDRTIAAIERKLKL
jgi:hypothetical protein